MNYSDEFIFAFQSGQVCLHPTDTIPGLCFDPLNPLAKKNLEKIKGRGLNKGFVCLVSSLEKALTWWQPLPEKWHQALTRLWPGPLTVVWSNKSAPVSVLDPFDKTLALRYPHLDEKQVWFQKVLQSLEVALPSTSCNKSNEPPKTSWHEARDFSCSQKPEIFIPSIDDPVLQENQLPSTIVRILPDGSYKILREGPITSEKIDRLLLP